MRAARTLTVLLAIASTLAACGGGGGGDGGTAARSAETPATTGTSTAGGAAADGEQVFSDSGCASCHTLAAANATGTTGPNLDEALPGKSKAFIRTSIVDPNADIAEGYSPGIMPDDFGRRLSRPELDALVNFLAENAGG